MWMQADRDLLRARPLPALQPCWKPAVRQEFHGIPPLNGDQTTARLGNLVVADDCEHVTDKVSSLRNQIVILNPNLPEVTWPTCHCDIHCSTHCSTHCSIHRHLPASYSSPSFRSICPCTNVAPRVARHNPASALLVQSIQLTLIRHKYKTAAQVSLWFYSLCAWFAGEVGSALRRHNRKQSPN